MSRTLLALAALWLTAPSFAAVQTAKSEEADKPIVITGQRLGELQKELADCLERKCPPDQDIAATLKVAETQFVDGDYKGAQHTLARSVGRNKSKAKDYPVPVSDLLRANSRIAAHLGEGEQYKIGTYDTVSALKAGLSEDDPRVLVSQIEIGDMFARFGRVDAAIDQYRSLAKHAGRLGLTNVRGLALLRIVSLNAQLAEGDPANFRTPAREAAAVLIKSTDPRMKPFAAAAGVVLARLDAKAGDPAAVDRIIASMRSQGPTDRPVLLYAPPLKTVYSDLDRRNSQFDGATIVSESTDLMSSDDYKGAWVDVSFWVTPDGRVNDVNVIRSGKASDPEPGWTKPITTAISMRRYAPLKMDSSEPGILRVERYTLTARYTAATGTRLRVREATPQIETLDLSVDPAPPPQSGG